MAPGQHGAEQLVPRQTIHGHVDTHAGFRTGRRGDRAPDGVGHGLDARTATEIPGALGWQNTALVVGCVGLVASVPLAMLVRNRPEDYGQHPDGIDPDTVTQTGPQQSTNGSAVAPDYSWQEAIRTRAFWLITMGHASSSIIIISVMTYRAW